MTKRNSIIDIVTHEDCYVAFLDILGFKEVVENNSHKQLQLFYESIENYVFNDFDSFGHLKNDIIDSNISCYFISDSIFLWSNDKSNTSYLHLAVLVKRIMVGGFMADLPLRGGIASGALTIKKTALGNTLFGKGLTNAYLLENKQEWSGCIIEQGIIDAVIHKNDECAQYIQNTPIFVKYNVPLKKGLNENYWTLNWPLILVRDNEELRKMFEEKGKKTNNETVLIKIKNTIDFYNDCISKHGDFREEYILNRSNK